ncbi:MAG: mandelate racemase/muconate lactonizing enzyme family protein [Vicinamibacterales bacterium]
MATSRRSFLRHAVAGSDADGRAILLTRAAGAAQAPPDGTRTYGHLGRTADYKDWAIVPRGLTIASVETFQRGSLALVRVTASDGRSGWGQVAPYDADITVDVLHRLVAPRVLKRDISEIDAINDDVIDAQLKYPWSFLCRALRRGHGALGPVRATLPTSPSPRCWAERCVPGGLRFEHAPRHQPHRRGRAPRPAARRGGLQGIQDPVRDPGGRNRDAAPGRSEAIIPTVRKAVGPDMVLFADANSCYTPDKAIVLGRMMEDAGYAAFEEPCPYWELEWTQEVTRALTMDVQGGEQDNDMAQWRRMIAMRAVDIVQPDICYTGGLTRAWRVAKMAEAAGLVTKPHAANVSFVTVFTMHLLAALPRAGEVEFSIEEDAGITREARAMFDPVLEMKDGKAVMPDGPGWGVHVKPAWLSSAAHRRSPA